MSAGNVITQIRRKQGRHDVIPAYSTAELLIGVRHKVHASEPRKKQYWNEGNAEKQRRSRAKFEQNKDAIYALLAEGRGMTHIAAKFRIGAVQLRKYLEEEGK